MKTLQKHTNGQHTDEKTFNITPHQGNKNRNYSDTSLNTNFSHLFQEKEEGGAFSNSFYEVGVTRTKTRNSTNTQKSPHKLLESRRGSARLRAQHERLETRRTSTSWQRAHTLQNLKSLTITQRNSVPLGKSNKTRPDQSANQESHSSPKTPSRAPGLGGSALGGDADCP